MRGGPTAGQLESPLLLGSTFGISSGPARKKMRHGVATFWGTQTAVQTESAFTAGQFYFNRHWLELGRLFMDLSMWPHSRFDR